MELKSGILIPMSRPGEMRTTVPFSRPKKEIPVKNFQNED